MKFFEELWFFINVPIFRPIFAKNINKSIELENNMCRIDQMSMLPVDRRVAPKNRVTFDSFKWG